MKRSLIVTSLVISIIVIVTVSVVINKVFVKQPVIPGQEWANAYVKQYIEDNVIEGNLSNISTDIVPNEETAIAIAVSVWNPIYGKEEIAAQAPYVAYLVGDYWVVAGTLPEGWLGGTAHAIISKRTAEVLQIIHYK